MLMTRRHFNYQAMSVMASLTALFPSRLVAEDIQSNVFPNAPLPVPEWLAHQHCVMAWCAQADLYSPAEIRAIRREQAVLARVIAGFEPVVMLVNPEDRAEAARMLGPGINLLEMEHNDVWTRDTLPVITSGPAGPIGVNLNFNGWGNEFRQADGHDPYAADKTLAHRFLYHHDMDQAVTPLVAEGGAIEIDGTGTLITTETCLLHPARNPGMDKYHIEDVFRRFLGINKVIWLHGSDADTVTDGHVDGMTRYVAPGVVVTEITDDREDPEYHDLQENLVRLRAAIDARGQRLKIHTIQRPYWDEMPERGDDFAASYVNFYLPNGGLVMPEFGDAARDNAARETLQALMPDRKIITMRADAIAEGGGGIHCNTWQMPA